MTNSRTKRFLLWSMICTGSNQIDTFVVLCTMVSEAAPPDSFWVCGLIIHNESIEQSFYLML